MIFGNMEWFQEFQQVGTPKKKEDNTDTDAGYSMEDPTDSNNEGGNEDPGDDDTNGEYSMGDVNTPDNEEDVTENPDGTEDNTDDLGDGEIPDDTDSDYSMGDDTSDLGGDDNIGDTTDNEDSIGDDTGSDLGGSENEEDNQDPDQNIKNIEQTLNSSLSPQDIEIRDKKLKLTFIDTYNIVSDIIGKLEDLPKNEDTSPEIDWLVGQASRLKGIIYDYIINNFDNKTYIQNYTTHSKYLVTLTGIKKILFQIKPKKEK